MDLGNSLDVYNACEIWKRQIDFKSLCDLESNVNENKQMQQNRLN